MYILCDWELARVREVSAVNTHYLCSIDLNSTSWALWQFDSLFHSISDIRVTGVTEDATENEDVIFHSIVTMLHIVSRCYRRTGA